MGRIMAHTRRHCWIGLAAGLVTLAGASACSSDFGSTTAQTTAPPAATGTPAQTTSGTPTFKPTFDPANFGTSIDNPYLTLTPGTTYTYANKTADATEIVHVEVTHRTENIAGVPSVVVHDYLTNGQTVVEDTIDWYAQDKQGNVWYMGEATKEFSPGNAPNTGGSWQAGVNGAEAGIAMPADSKVGEVYRQEYYKGEAEDTASTVGFSGVANVPYGSYKNLLEIKEWTPLEPSVEEHKYYARGVGLVRSVATKGGTEQQDLVTITLA